MELIQAVEQRRAVKHYDPEYTMSQEDIDKLMGLAVLSPTSFNIQNWRFVLVRDPELRAEVRKNAWDQAQVTDASLLILLCADLKSWQKEPKRYWRNAPQEVQDFLVPAIGQFYEGREETQRDEAMRSAGIAAQTIMLAAKSMGLDSCPMIGFDSVEVGKLINLPEDHVIGLMISVGKATKQAWERGGQLDLSEVVIENRF